MDFQVGQLSNASWILYVVVIFVVSAVAMVMHRRAVRDFATPNLLQRLLPSGIVARSIVSAALTLFAMCFLVIALLDIRWGKVWREVPQRGIEVIFALDVSRSMLAQDVKPSRLDRAKQDIKDIVNEMEGDRVGLVLFAGDVKRHVPLTNHYDDFKQSLDEVGPHNISRGGSNLGQAIRVASESFLEKSADHKALVLITDGEDHESKPVSAAVDARDELGVRIFTVGLGDMQQGARIPMQTRSRQPAYIEHEGQQIWSKLNGEVLKKIASVTEGAYIPAGTKQVDMAAVYHRFIRSIEQQEFDTAKINSYVPRYPWFLGAALLLLIVDTAISVWPRRLANANTQAFGAFAGSDRR